MLGRLATSIPSSSGRKTTDPYEYVLTLLLTHTAVPGVITGKGGIRVVDCDPGTQHLVPGTINLSRNIVNIYILKFNKTSRYNWGQSGTTVGGTQYIVPGTICYFDRKYEDRWVFM